MDQDILRRLSYCRYLYTLAYGQSNKSEPYNSFSLLTFHHAAELFLQLSADYLGVSKRIHEFMEYWPEINQKLGKDGLSQQSSMDEFNKARVGLKHHGILPSKVEIERFRTVLKNFFDENTETVFGLKFAESRMDELMDHINLMGR